MIEYFEKYESKLSVESPDYLHNLVWLVILEALERNSDSVKEHAENVREITKIVNTKYRDNILNLDVDEYSYNEMSDPTFDRILKIKQSLLKTQNVESNLMKVAVLYTAAACVSVDSFKRKEFFTNSLNKLRLNLFDLDKG